VQAIISPPEGVGVQDNRSGLDKRKFPVHTMGGRRWNAVRNAEAKVFGAIQSVRGTIFISVQESNFRCNQFFALAFGAPGSVYPAFLFRKRFNGHELPGQQIGTLGGGTAPAGWSLGAGVSGHCRSVAVDIKRTWQENG